MFNFMFLILEMDIDFSFYLWFEYSIGISANQISWFSKVVWKNKNVFSCRMSCTVDVDEIKAKKTKGGEKFANEN